MMTRRLLALVAATLALSACGAKGSLEPLPGETLPPAPFGAESAPEPEQLLAPDTLAAPERSVELRRRSEEREDDPFDLPPE